VENGVTQPVFPFANAIEETVFVESEVDSDGDGRLDRVRIRISRPGETESQGIKVPVVFEHSPYRGDLGSAVNHNVDLDRLPQEVIAKARPARAATARAKARARARARAGARAAARTRADLPGQLDNYYVPRGYAVVLGESLGTFNSDGCPDVGGSGETLGTKAVIDWLNGRARGWNEAGEPVRADWTTGAVGMVGLSYNGTLPNQVATPASRGSRRSFRSPRSRAGTTTTARTASWWPPTPRRKAWARTSSSGRTPTSLGRSSADRA
jgi:X-Pro dipeptidyl-peptidase